MSQTFNTDGGIHEVPLDGTVGKLWLCGKHFIGPDVEAVRAERDITYVVCLVEEHELRHHRQQRKAVQGLPIPHHAVHSSRRCGHR